MKSLVVDDNPLMTELLIINMKHLGYEVDAAGDGLDAVSKMEGNCYDVVITDGYMPKMTGFELCRFIRSRYPSTYIIGVTGSSNLEEFKEAGADAYFPKPFRFSKLQQAIESRFN
jgi:CheY-like chemotaxis protein